MKKFYETPDASLFRFAPADALANGVADDDTTEPDDSIPFDDMFN